MDRELTDEVFDETIPVEGVIKERKSDYDDEDQQYPHQKHSMLIDSPDLASRCLKKLDSSSDRMDRSGSQQSSQALDIDEHSEHCKLNDNVETHLMLSDLPEEILERILEFLSPYNDQDSAKLVCHQWYRLVKALVKKSKRNFSHRIGCNKVRWVEVVQSPGIKDGLSPPACFRLLSISERYSHSCAYWNGSMYVFGGCTSTNTTFNDLWRLDLTTRRWIRPVAKGSYPSPKACASMVVYDDKLILFGGWSHPIPYPLHQSANYFSELHMYDPVNNYWSLLLSLGAEPDALGGHSASMVGDKMVVFGGSPRPGQGSNKLWVYDFVHSLWYIPKTKAGVCPEPRYGQYQCTLDDNHILVMGGWGGSPMKIYNDFYLLSIENYQPWFWTKLEILQPQFAPCLNWCHSVCKVGDQIVILCKSSKPRESLNVKPNVFCVENTVKKRQNESTQSSISLDSSQAVHESGEQNDSKTSPQGASSNSGSLLALQQKLHRKCISLTEEASHLHNPLPDDNIPESQIHRLQNRVSSQEDRQNPHPYLPPRNVEQNSHSQYQDLNQPHAGQLRRANPPYNRDSHSMPSIRPNASSNRQKQLEALQRQEELLKSKAKAIAEARKKERLMMHSPMDEDIPTTVPVKNRMDVHIVDISNVLSDGQVKWKPESTLQPVGAPVETVCCSLVEGRSELILFGGVLREATFPMVQNTALNKLYILHT